MATKDLKTLINPAVGINATLSGETPAKGNVINMAGFASLAFCLMTGAVTDAGTADGFSIILEHSDTTADADFAAVGAADHTGALAVTADGDDGVVVGKIGYSGSKQYVRLLVTGTTGTDAEIVGMAILGNPDYAPADTIIANIAAT